MANNKSFIKDILKELSEENLGIFAGAGFSMAAGFVSWKELLRPISDEIGLDIDKEKDLLAVAQYHCNENSSNRHKLSQQIIDEFSRIASTTRNHEIIAKLPINEYWTTNYDKLLESALIENGRIPDVKYTNEQLAYTKPRRDCIVYKMHGDVDHADKAILTKDDYESYYLTHGPYITALSGSLVSKTFLFIGFSFTDPNLDYILSRIRVNYHQNQRRHFCFLRSVSEDEYHGRRDEFEYDKLKQELFIKDLQRFNIKTILVSEYIEITQLLEEIFSKYKRKTIFISGAAHEYYDWDKFVSFEMMHELSKSLIAKEYKIVSGFGLGVGSSIITGALEEIYLAKKQSISNQLILRPFPQDITGKIPKDELWNKYRSNMCEYAGVAIFIFGNKLVDGKTINSDGLIKEFDIALDKGLFTIPIGSTGYVAKQIYDMILVNPTKYGYSTPDLINELKILGTSKKTEDIVSSVLRILDIIT